jgi:hypothetical protein
MAPAARFKRASNVFHVAFFCAQYVHMRQQMRKKSSAFDNVLNGAEGQKSLLDNYLTDSIHVKC